MLGLEKSEQNISKLFHLFNQINIKNLPSFIFEVLPFFRKQLTAKLGPLYFLRPSNPGATDSFTDLGKLNLLMVDRF